MGVKVSVIVSIHNPGGTADPCIRSVLDQTIDSYEVIFVDDGSTDGAAGRLDTIAKGRPHVRVLHLPHTGSPMRGRNVGIANATGDYVFLLDQHDRLERDALRLMHERAVEYDSDVLIGRLVRDGEAAPLPAYEIDLPRADILGDRLLSLLMPQKLYRRAFLERHFLGFAVPGGYVAEQLFSLKAYLLAEVVTVLAEPICGHLGERPEREESLRVVLAELRTLLAAVQEYAPSAQHDRMYAHWFRTTVLRPLLTARFAGSSLDRGEVFGLCRELVLEHFPPRLDRHLPVHLRVVAMIVREGRVDQLVTFVNAARRNKARADLFELRWEEDVLLLGLAVELFESAEAPVLFQADGERLHWSPPELGVDLPPDVTDVTEAAGRARMDVYLRREGTGVVYFVPVDFRVERLPHGDRLRLRVVGEARLDVAGAALGEPLDSGRWEVHVRMHGGVHHARARVGRAEGPLSCPGILAPRPRQRLVVPCWSEKGELGLAIEPDSFSESVALVSPGASVTRQDDHVFVVVPVPYVPPSGGPALELVLRNTSGRLREITAPAMVEPGVPGRLAGQLVAKVPVKRAFPGPEELGPGGWLTALRGERGETGLRFGLEMRGGDVAVRPTAYVVPALRATLPSDSRLRRFVRLMPGARHLVRLARAGRARYLL